MKKFKFKLEAVLTERKRVEDLLLREWVEAKNILLGMINEKVELETRLAEAVDEMTETGGASMGLRDVMENFISGQKVRIGWKVRQIERAEKLVEKKRLQYVAARQKREAIEKLKERQLEQYKALAKKLERKALDDTYIMNGAFKIRQKEEEELNP